MYKGMDELSLIEAHSIYERNKRFLDSKILATVSRRLSSDLALR